MKLLAIVGIVLVVIGLIGLLQGGVSYTKSRDSTNLGPLTFTMTEKEHLAIHPAIGAIVLLAGGVILATCLRRG